MKKHKTDSTCPKEICRQSINMGLSCKECVNTQLLILAVTNNSRPTLKMKLMRLFRKIRRV